jgi:TPP-dependent pyruvate/acetoin dehydrogenase alpha subunit
MTAGRGAAARAESLGIPSIEVDGNDIVAVDDAASELLSAVRDDGGPRFLIARTYRLTGHTAADAAPYRSEQEVSEAWRNDPIERCGNTLRHAGVADEELAAADARAAADIRRAFEIAKTAPWPDPADAFTDVQDVGAQGRDVQAEGAAL